VNQYIETGFMGIVLLYLTIPYTLNQEASMPAPFEYVDYGIGNLNTGQLKSN